MNSTVMSSPTLTTLDESVSVTLKRDLKKIGYRLGQVLIPRSNANTSDERYQCLRDWDLWFPLIVCFVLSSSLETISHSEGAAFSLVFGIVWIGALVVSINTTLLGGNASLFQSVSLLCYCLAPLSIVAILSMFLQNWTLTRFILTGVAVFWGTTASLGFFAGLVPAERRALATYPVWLFFLGLGVLSWASGLQS
ncbi:hypothetical protein GEMRC1_012617 [Eukaryota sp. GEM-RC1]